MNPKHRNRPRKHRSLVVEEIKKQMNPLASARSKKKLIIASKIAEALDKNEMKRIDLAAQLGKEPSNVTRWTKGDHNFSVDMLSDLEEVLGISLLSPYKTSGKNFSMH